VIWTKEAVNDLQRLFDFLNEKSPGAAKRAASHIKQTADQLTYLSEIGKPLPDDTGRREIFTSFGKRGYAIRYMLDDEKNPVIIRVWHTLEQR